MVVIGMTRLMSLRPAAEAELIGTAMGLPQAERLCGRFPGIAPSLMSIAAKRWVCNS
jgi:hypothetical protein